MLSIIKIIMLNRYKKFQCYKHLRIYKWIILLLFITNLPLRKYISLTMYHHISSHFQNFQTFFRIMKFVREIKINEAQYH